MFIIKEPFQFNNMENETDNTGLEDVTVLKEEAVEDSISENEEKESQEDLSLKEQTISEIMKAAKIREDLIDKNKSLQHKLSAYIKESAEKDYFQTLDLPLVANEKDFAITLKKIDDKKSELEKFRGDVTSKLVYLKTEIAQKQEELSDMRNSFTALKEKVALQSVNSENGDCLSQEEVRGFLKKEDDMRKTLEYFQLEAIKKRHYLRAAMENKKNLVDGPLDYGEFEIMCTKTENNTEVNKQLRQEIKDFTRKSTNVVNALSHLNQKLISLQNEKSAAEEKETLLEEELDGMRNDLFKETTEYSAMNAKNKELQHKCILLQHPRLLEDHKSIAEENEQAKKELEELKNTYQILTDIISQ